MTQARIYGTRAISAVRLPNYTSFYGFRTNITAAAKGVFGQTEILLGTPFPGTIIMGANRPRPPRGRILSSGISSYIDRDSYGSTEIQVIDRGIGQIVPRQSTKSIRVEASYYTAQYAWDMPLWQHARIQGDLAGLGVTPVTGTNNNDAYLGIDFAWTSAAGTGGARQPNRAQKVMEPAGDVTRFTVTKTFTSTPFTGTLPDGWTLIEGSPWI
ncbi:hypothetical protein [Sodalinema gerasimenkoae]|uniref:hypothetical protein n=1 Tax=Sodalinema gerasimenkoae TaxID=2862348 RepID=UPI0013576079|nr:hypothetical protein [Sodalinema gerasimenkoae]